MHILVIPSWYATPTNPIRGSFFREQALALQKAGHQVGMIIPPSRFRTLHGLREFRHNWKFPNTRIAITTDAGLRVYRIPWWGWRPLFLPRWRGELGVRVFDNYCQEMGTPDVLHAHSILYAGFLATYIGSMRSLPVVLTEHSSLFLRNLFFPGQPQIVRYTLRNVGKILAVSPALATALQKHAPEKMIEVLGNLVDTEFFSPPYAELATSPFRFATISSLVPLKGHEILLRAFRKVFRGQEVVLDIAGDGPERSRLERLCNGLGLMEQVTFLGRLTREEIRDLIRRSHAVVSASHVETFGLTLIEACACGKPVIATFSGGPESIVNERNGLLVSTRDSDALAQALQQLVQTYNRYNRDVIRADCVARFSEGAVVERLEQIYKTLTRHRE